MRLDDLDLLRLMPKFMRDDKTTDALCQAVEPELKAVNAAKKTGMVLPYIDDAPEWLLDELAWENNLTWYDTAVDINTKRRIIQSANYVKRHLGTVGAVERTVSDYFGDGYVEEWFDYDGDPYMFRVWTTNTKVSDELADRFRMALNATKNVRSHLETIIVDQRAPVPLHVAAVYHDGEMLMMKVGAD